MKTRLDDINEQLEKVKGMIELHKDNPSDFMLNQYISIREKLLSEKMRILSELGGK